MDRFRGGILYEKSYGCNRGDAKIASLEIMELASMAILLGRNFWRYPVFTRLAGGAALTSPALSGVLRVSVS